MNPYDTPHSQRDLDALARETPRLTCANSPCSGRLCGEIDAAGCHCAARSTERAAEVALGDFTATDRPEDERALSGPEIDPVTTVRAQDVGSARLAGEDK
ncbi:hypothetical protein D2T31_11980 [Sinirhodobacter populi]|uniref:Uncharacterized protein n=1 Tax=Paenirhodobacter populi TaxID=2306993 RepID=A0A443K7U8_9RHOB|nr:hypothetical protein [Sinirhodobacter populi]RWR28825.1 hypothetical protein D2T31_11980 [Sinirhodobacter populi]